MNPDISQLYGDGGYFRIFVSPPGGTRQDLSFFRGVPTQITQMSSTDPFGDNIAAISFPSITSFDRPGTGDLSWLVPWANVDILFYDETDVATGWTWEGFIVSEEVGENYAIQCKGAMFQADNFLAAPWYPFYPLPYEQLIMQTLDPAKHLTLRTSKVRVEFPDDWKVKAPAFTDPDYLWYLRPWGVNPGQNWTGLTSRNTGGWEPILTGFIQNLLSVMFTEDGGQWSLYKDPGRIPVLKVRPALRQPTDDTLTVYNGAPGVSVSFSRDFTQSANVIYGSGTDLNGSAYSGQQVTRTGSSTFWEPFAASSLVYPADPTNPRLNRNIMRKEARLTFPNGMDQISAKDAAATQLRRVADPGYTGTLTLSSDPLKSGVPFNRQLIKAGASILVKNLRGTDVLFHISEATCSPATGEVTLTMDTKFRDALTVAEIRARTRDALDPIRVLKVGKNSVATNDLIKPWSYMAGSGIIPSGGGYSATALFAKAEESIKFPWTSLTTKYPPKKYPGYYIKIGPKSANAKDNWSHITRNKITGMSIPVMMSQAGTIRLTQIAAYDENGNVLPVRFHVSIYSGDGVNVLSMPKIPASMGNTTGVPYPAAQPYPFFKGAFESINDDGTNVDTPNTMLAQGAGLLIGWGNYYEQAGYSPGSTTLKSPKTGLLVDETKWGFDLSGVNQFDTYHPKNNAKNPSAGMAYIMIYCDDQGTKPVYFLGRMFADIPSTGGGT